MPLSEYAKNSLMEHLFRSQVYISLHSSDPAGDGANEISGGSYARQTLMQFTQAKNGEKASSKDLMFEDMPKTAVTHIGVWDKPTGGNLLWGAELLAKKNVDEGDTFKVGAGRLILGIG